MFKKNKPAQDDDWRKLFDGIDVKEVHEYHGEEARRTGIQMIKDAAGGVKTLEEAHTILLGRPTLEAEKNREKTEQVQVRVPHSWRKRIDEVSKAHGMSRSTYLRELIAKAIF